MMYISPQRLKRMSEELSNRVEKVESVASIDLSEYPKKGDIGQVVTAKVVEVVGDSVEVKVQEGLKEGLKEIHSTVDSRVQEGLSKIDAPTKQEVNSALEVLKDSLLNTVSELATGVPEGFLDEYATKGYLSSTLSEIKQEIQDRLESIDDKPPSVVRNGRVIKVGDLKIWTGEVVSSEKAGFFTVDFSEAGYETPPEVFVTALSQNGATDESANNANWACLIKDSITTTGCRGRAKNADSAGALVAVVSTNIECIVKVLAIGI